MTQDEIIEMAVQAEFVSRGNSSDEESELFVCVDKDIVRFANLIAAKAIAELQSQEPVALQYPQKDIDWQREQQIKAQASTPPQGIYYTPPQRTWVGLTDVEIDYLLGSTAGENEETHISFARAIESNLKQKNS